MAGMVKMPPPAWPIARVGLSFGLCMCDWFCLSLLSMISLSLTYTSLSPVRELASKDGRYVR